MYIIAMLHNQALNRFHPIVFRPAPFPGGHEPSAAERYRSASHHTEGFVCRNEARQCAESELAPQFLGARLALDGDIVWDGKDVPSLTLIFGTVDGQLRPLF
jgi:hypothetical protein